tara:strand:- start:68 stop:382 length:315 start_codon:yes stop_codon:yes gene_type:complete
MFAVIESGNKQHKVEEGMTIEIDLLQTDKKEIVFDHVLLFANEKDIQIGQPYLENVTVSAKVVDEVKGEKLKILRFRRRKNSMRKIGHRQKFTKVKIEKINLGS